MATRLSPDFEPHPRVYELLSTRFGITIESAREFCGHQLGVFKLHFETRDDAKAVKSNWNTAFYNWMAKAFEDQKEQVALHRELVPRTGNLFEEALAGTIAQADGLETPEKRARRYKAPPPQPIPGAGETMSEEEALEALAKFRRKS